MSCHCFTESPKWFRNFCQHYTSLNVPLQKKSVSVFHNHVRAVCWSAFFFNADPSCDHSSTWTNVSLKEWSLEFREAGGSSASQIFQFSMMSGVQCDSMHYYVEDWSVLSLCACRESMSQFLEQLNIANCIDSFLSGQEINQYGPLWHTRKLSPSFFEPSIWLLFGAAVWCHYVLSFCFGVRIVEPAYITSHDVQ
jgi:hypothetical protein